MTATFVGLLPDGQAVLVGLGRYVAEPSGTHGANLLDQDAGCFAEDLDFGAE